MKLCSICGAQTQDTDTFCSACGSQLEPTVLNAPDAPENPISAVTQTEAATEQKTNDLEEKTASDAEKMNMPEAPHPLYQPRAHAQANATQQTPPCAQNGAYAPPAYRARYNDDPVTMGEWMLDLIVLNIPVLGFIMTFVWGFGTSAKPSLRNFARAMLVFKVILFILTVLMIVLFVTVTVTEPQIYYQYSGY